MRIGIIGAGSMGSTLARPLARRGHRVSLANSRGPQSLTAYSTLKRPAIPIQTRH
jgi:predicted dinucleotide-binding enzyme